MLTFDICVEYVKKAYQFMLFFHDTICLRVKHNDGRDTDVDSFSNKFPEISARYSITSWQ